MTDAEKVEHLRAALERIATPNAFYVATSNVDPEAFARMTYADQVLKGVSLVDDESVTGALTRKRYARSTDTFKSKEGGQR